jgi:hypothetical protein
LSYNGTDKAPAELTDDEVEMTFRRIHIVSSQGDPLEALIKIGQRSRDLLIDFWSQENPFPDTLSSPPFDTTFADILSDLDELITAGINPDVELSMRKGSGVMRQNFEAWLWWTQNILTKAPLGAKFSREKVNRIGQWLCTWDVIVETQDS